MDQPLTRLPSPSSGSRVRNIWSQIEGRLFWLSQSGELLTVGVPIVVKTYKSAVDLWLAAILIGLPLAVIVTGVSITLGLDYLHWHEDLGRYAGFFLIGIGAVTETLIGAFTLPCRYTLEETGLHIQCGILKSVVIYRDIRRLELSCSLWAAPALSVNRVKIILDDGFQLISPKNRPEFIQALQARIDQHG